MPALGAYIHAKNLSFALYTAESDETCGGYPASANHEVIDANTFARWGVDCACACAQRGRPRALACPELSLTLSRARAAQSPPRADLKVDGCGPDSYYAQGYKAMGAALEASGRPIVYSCSWPAYINGGNESLQPFGTFIDDGCNVSGPQCAPRTSFCSAGALTPSRTSRRAPRTPARPPRFPPRAVMA
jgi:hypothetical protein